MKPSESALAVAEQLQADYEQSCLRLSRTLHWEAWVEYLKVIEDAPRTFENVVASLKLAADNLAKKGL